MTTPPSNSHTYTSHSPFSFMSILQPDHPSISLEPSLQSISDRCWHLSYTSTKAYKPCNNYDFNNMHLGILVTIIGSSYIYIKIALKIGHATMVCRMGWCCLIVLLLVTVCGCLLFLLLGNSLVYRSRLYKFQKLPASWREGYIIPDLHYMSQLGWIANSALLVQIWLK